MADLYREVEHTADLSIAVEAADLPALYARAGLALFALLVDTSGVALKERRAVKVDGQDREDLLHEWLARLLADFYTEGFVAAAITVNRLETTSIEATIEGERFQRGRHELLREIKAVTYHALRVRQSATGWEAEVTFDV